MAVALDLPAVGGVERSAFGVVDALVHCKRGLLGAARIVDALLAGERVDVVKVEIEVAADGAKLRRLRQAGVRIFRGDLGERKRGGDHLVEAFGGKVAAVGGSGALPAKDAHADRPGAGFLQRLDLPEAYDGGEFIALAHHGFGSGGAAAKGAVDDIGCDFFQIYFFQYGCHAERSEASTHCVRLRHKPRSFASLRMTKVTLGVSH